MRETGIGRMILLSMHMRVNTCLFSRLGISELAMVDCDTVAASNVNRQVLYATGDVGRKKVEAALEGLYRDKIQTSKRLVREATCYIVLTYSLSFIRSYSSSLQCCN